MKYQQLIFVYNILLYNTLGNICCIIIIPESTKRFRTDDCEQHKEGLNERGKTTNEVELTQALSHKVAKGCACTTESRATAEGNAKTK